MGVQNGLYYALLAALMWVILRALWVRQDPVPLSMVLLLRKAHFFRDEELRMDLGLKGKTALVLGGGGGLGRAIAKSLATEGANVAVAGIGLTSIDGAAADLKAIGGKCIGLIWDLADLSVINANISKIENELGPVDILVNNTGGPPPASAAGQDPALWATQFQLMVLSIIAITDCENTASVALLERLEIRREGHFLQNVWFKGKWGDEYLYAILKEEWLRKQGTKAR